MLNKNNRKPKFYLLLVLIFGAFFTLAYLFTQQRAHEKLESHGTASRVYKDSFIHFNKNSQTPQNAVFLLFTKNEDLYKAKKTIYQIEAAFNEERKYPYLFLSNEPFTEEFVRSISKIISSKAEFEVVPNEHWEIPNWVDKTKLKESLKELSAFPHGDSTSYRQVMRYMSGFFYKHPRIQKYDYYWKLQPGAEYPCDITFDPFERLNQLNKQYAFTVTVKDFEPTIKSLGRTVAEYLEINNGINSLSINNSMAYVSDHNDIASYNNCHFWSNFEIGKLSFFSSSKYQSYFDFLDKSGNFFYERWGDGPVHTIALSLFLDKSQIWFADEIGYSYTGIEHCPLIQNSKNKCGCLRSGSVDYSSWSCLSKFEKVFTNQG